MYKIKLMDDLSEPLKKRLHRNACEVIDAPNPDAIFVRSSEVPDEMINENLLVIGRGGIGVNTINVEKSTENGTAVFNTPGVNANAVKELVISSLLLSVRPLLDAMNMVQGLSGDNILEQAEANRGDLVGEELAGKTVGVLGLGDIGDRVAQMCDQMGMEVLGYARTPRKKSYYEQVELDELLAESDFVVVLLPLSDATEKLLGKEEFAHMKDGAVLLNFGRGPIIDDQAVLEALDAGKLAKYISDFPNEQLLGHEKIILLPHIGGTTYNALEDGGRQAVKRIQNYLLYGTVEESVNFPHAKMELNSPLRLAIFYRNESRAFSKILSQISDEDLAIDNLTSERKDNYAYSLIDISDEDIKKANAAAKKLAELPEIVRIRVLENPNQNK